ncbi:hypothetical protein [Pleomorphomonas sp. PLEO]|uniref:hypothetical protein n=1 Tax=Pleomorphomonas sp. PLEO TaxID=3239306 RepID=UPI00351F6171
MTHAIAFSRMSRDLAVEQSLDAAMEIQEVISGEKVESPALRSLVEALIGSNGGGVYSKNDLLGKARIASLYGKAYAYGEAYASSGVVVNQAEQLEPIIDLLLQVDSGNLSNIPKEGLAQIKNFCLGLNRTLAAEAFGRIPDAMQARQRSRTWLFNYES